MQAHGVPTRLPMVNPPRISRGGAGRAAAFAIALAAAAALLTAGTMMAPVRAPVLPAGERLRYMDVAIAAAALVVLVVTAWLLGLRARARRASGAQPPGVADVRAAGPDHGADARVATLRARFAPLAVLRPEVVPTRLIVITAVTALAMDAVAWVLGFPPWGIVSAALIPFIPLLFAEGVRKYQHYGLYAAFGAITLLQVGHLGEHTVQVIQVFVFNGDLARAHGLFGQLDFETVHFVWDSIVWIGLGVLLVRFGGTNRWLWVSFAAASIHEVEHLYLFFIYRADPGFYTDGGFAGIMGANGLIGSPLGRPYLHFAYNVCVIVPLIFAFWDQTVRVHRDGVRTAADRP